VSEGDWPHGKPVGPDGLNDEIQRSIAGQQKSCTGKNTEVKRSGERINLGQYPEKDI
jgi:hypothetical protein